MAASFLRALARHAGVHIYNERDDAFYACWSYLAVNADGAGARTIYFPRPTDVFDPFTGKCLQQCVKQFTRNFAAGETMLVRLRKAG